MDWESSVLFIKTSFSSYFIQERATLLTLNYGDMIYEMDDPPNGIFIIVSGMVKTLFRPTSVLIEVQLVIHCTFSLMNHDFTLFFHRLEFLESTNIWSHTKYRITSRSHVW